MSIATYIKRDLEARLQSGRGVPDPLTLESLAGHYEVSFTPVRTAVAQLIESGLLERGSNRRLIAPKQSAPVGPAVKPPTPPQLPGDVFDAISRDLVDLSLQGNPVYLREEATAERYAISRSAIRNIFHRLAGAGMLDHIPRRGWRLRPFRHEDMQAFLEVRELLELKALELAQPHLRKADLRAILDRNVVPTTPDETPQVDNTLHAYMIKQAGNPYIEEFLTRHGRYYDLLFDWEDLDRETAIETIRQHHAILEALLNADWPTARKALSYHIRWNHPILSRIAPFQSPLETETPTALSQRTPPLEVPENQ